jgi:hypothetical protein
VRLTWPPDSFPPRLVRAAYVFVNGFLTIALLALLAVLTQSLFVFSSLGPRRISYLLHPWQTTLAREIHFWVMQSVSSAAMLHSN